MATNPVEQQATKTTSPCGHDFSLYETTSGRKLPIMLGPWKSTGGCSLWCDECSTGSRWRPITREQYQEIKGYFGGAC